MIRYALHCNKSHAFEAWFRNSDTYERQAKRGEIRCPDCGSPKVKKAIMAPAIGSRGSEAPPAAAEAPPVPAPPAPAPTVEAPAPEARAMHVSAKLHEMVREMQRYIEKHADYVGPKFADEARKIHYGEAAERSIYGEASDQDADELRDEGIEFGRIPWPKQRHDA